MDIPLNAEARCRDSPCGRSTYIIIAAGTGRVTHVVVQDERTPPRQHLIALSAIEATDADSISLRCTADELAAIAPFVMRDRSPRGGQRRHRLNEAGRPAKAGPTHARPPRLIAVALRTRVRATNANLGLVDNLLIDRNTARITHLVLRESHVWGHRGFVIPIEQVERLDSSPIRLKMDRRSILALPAIPVKRWRHHV